MYVIEISGLKKRFEKGGFCLDLPEMRVPEGYITGFIGENGAGKTTTLKLMMDMLYPDEGTIRILGLDAHLQGPQHAGVSRPCHAGNPQADARAVLSKLGRGPLPEVL